MVKPTTNTTTIDTGQIDGKCAMGNPRYGDQEKKLANLDECATRNHKEAQRVTTTPSKIACSTSNKEVNQSDVGQKEGRNIENTSRNTIMEQFFSKKEKNQQNNDQVSTLDGTNTTDVRKVETNKPREVEDMEVDFVQANNKKKNNTIKEANGKQVSGKSGGACGIRKNSTPLNEQLREQKDKKQKVECNDDLDWENMDDKQHEMHYVRHQMGCKDNIYNEENEDKTNDSDTESAETIDNQSMRTIDQHDRHSAFEITTYTVQVSHKLKVEKFNEEKEKLREWLTTSSVKFVRKWFRQGLIKGVIQNGKNKVIEDFSSYDEWIKDVRVIGKKKKYVQLYFQVQSIVPWKTLIDEGKDEFRVDDLSIILKRTAAKGWNKKIGMLTGPKATVASLKEYEIELQNAHGISLNDFELKRKIEKEGSIEALCIVVHAIESEAETIDLKLREMILNKVDIVSYFSFINGSSQERKSALLLNRFVNVKMKYEVLKNIHVKESVTTKGVEMTVRKALSLVSVNGVSIFQAIEQGRGNRNKDMFVYYHPEHKQLINKWFENSFMEGMKLGCNRKIETSVKKQTEEQQQYSENIKDHFSKMLIEKEATMKSLHEFRTPVSYADVLKGKMNKEDDDNVSNMTEGSHQNDENNEQSNYDVANDGNKDCSDTDDNSQWSKESAIKRLNELSGELKRERKERYEEKVQMQKEREENQNMLQGMLRFQNLILNLNDDDTDEEISFEVRKISKKLQKRKEKMIQQDEKSEKMKESKVTETNNKITTKYEQRRNSKNTRKREIEHEMNQLKQAGLQSPPKMNKSDSSRKTTHSSVTEIR